jgi:hypothetical protein
VGSLSRKRHTQYVEHNRKGRLQEQEEAGRGPAMEDMLCAMVLKSASGRPIQHTQAGLLVCCERALKIVDERTTHGGVPVRGPPENGKPPREREVTLRGGVQRHWMI